MKENTGVLKEVLRRRLILAAEKPQSSGTGERRAEEVL